MKSLAQMNARESSLLTATKLTCVALLACAFTAAAQTAPPAPTLVQPANGAALVQPITLGWSTVVDPDGPIGSYLWQVGTSSSFTTIIAQGFQNMISDTVPTPTQDKVSGLPNGTYFWRVKATQIVGGAVFSIDSAWSQVRTFTVTGLGAAPGTPSITSPASPSSFHVREFFYITWNAVPGANYYLLEADDEPTFSYPLTLTTDLIQFGTKFRAGWGNEIPNIYYRVRAVSADNVRSLPSPTLNVHVVNTAPVPPPPTPLSPVDGTSLSIPGTFDWSDNTPNPLLATYDLDIDDEPNFLGAVGVLLVGGVNRSDYMVVPDPLVEGINHFPPGQYFWRVRAVHGDVSGPWSAGASFNVVASPTVPGLEIFSLVTDSPTAYGGNPTRARVTLNMPAPAGGVSINVASDLPHAQMPAPTILIPEGKTDGIVSPITTVPVQGDTVGTIRAAYGLGWQQSSFGLSPILWDLSLSAEGVVGGNAVTGTFTLLNPAPPSGVEVTLISSDTSLVATPAKVLIPSGAFSATFNIPTAPVSVPTWVPINCGTAFEGYRAPGASLFVLPPGSPALAPSLASLSLASNRILGESSTTGTVTLTGPAPAGGASVRVNGSMAGQVVTPQNVTVPAGSTSASFTINAPQVSATNYVLIQGSYGNSGGNQAQLLEIDPGPPGAPTLFAMAVKPFQGIGGQTFRGTVQLIMPAPPGGGSVSLSSDNPAAQVPATVSIAAGNSANSFTITTSPVTTSTPVNITATAGGVTKSFFIYLGPDPNAPPLLQSVTISPTSVSGGTSATGTILLSAPAPAGGASVTLSTSSLSVASVPPVVNVPAGQTSATFTVTTFTVSANTVATITAFLGSATQSASLTVTSGGAPPTPGRPGLLSPTNGAPVSQPVTLDWTDASNAASYEIQIDDNSNFTTPLVRSLTSTASQITVSGLPNAQLFWRVRARNSAGVAGSFSASRRFTAQAAPTAPTLSSLSLSPSTVVGGNSSQGTVTLSSAAPTGGAVVTLSSSTSAVASTPASVTVAAGATTATFAISTVAVSVNNTVTISAAFSGTTRTATLTVTPVPPPPPPASLSSLTLSPNSVTGANTSQGTVTLTSAAPSGGAVVALSSANTSVATVPASVTVAAGATSASFTVTSLSVASATPVTISANYNSVTQSATLTVNPVPTGTLPAPSLVSPAADARFAPGANITFDWSDVAGAANYTLQIDDSDTFSSSFIVNQTVTTSHFTSSTLPTTRMWWRVRANDASGNPGNWSSARRFELRN